MPFFGALMHTRWLPVVWEKLEDSFSFKKKKGSYSSF
jgi:hypothetical protein